MSINTKEDAEAFNDLYSEILKFIEEHKENISSEQYQKTYKQLDDIKRDAWNDLVKYYVIPSTTTSSSSQSNRSNISQQSNISEENEELNQEQEYYPEDEFSPITAWE